MIAVAHYSSARRGSRVGAALFVIAACRFARAAACGARRRRRVCRCRAERHDSGRSSRVPRAEPRVSMLAARRRIARIHPPACGRGAAAEFRAACSIRARRSISPPLRPTGPDPVWAAVATGNVSGQERRAVRRATIFALGNEQPHRSAARLLFRATRSYTRVRPSKSRTTPPRRRSSPLWNILSAEGIPVGVVGWPLTYPAPSVHGFVVSDRFHELLGSTARARRARRISRDRAANRPGRSLRRVPADRRRPWPPARRPSTTDSGATVGLAIGVQPHAPPICVAAVDRAVPGRPLPEPRHGRPLLPAATHSRSGSARSQTTSAAATAGSGALLHATSMPKSATRSTRSVRTICSSSCLGMGWSVEPTSSGCSGAAR